MRRLKGRDTSASSSVTSEGTLTPDIIQDITVVPFSDDGETSSVYSCDTEGYYTSFHMDSGLKTLREEEPVPQSPLTKSNDIGSDPTSPVIENEYELFGRGSTSTTTSSAGTVCTALMAPPPPERKSSLTVVAMVSLNLSFLTHFFNIYVLVYRTYSSAFFNLFFKNFVFLLFAGPRSKSERRRVTR